MCFILHTTFQPAGGCRLTFSIDEAAKLGLGSVGRSSMQMSGRSALGVDCGSR